MVGDHIQKNGLVGTFGPESQMDIVRLLSGPHWLRKRELGKVVLLLLLLPPQLPRIGALRILDDIAVLTAEQLKLR